jgi:hypothetical protein
VGRLAVGWWWWLVGWRWVSLVVGGWSVFVGAAQAGRSDGGLAETAAAGRRQAQALTTPATPTVYLLFSPPFWRARTCALPPLPSSYPPLLPPPTPPPLPTHRPHSAPPPPSLPGRPPFVSRCTTGARAAAGTSTPACPASAPTPALDC